MSTTLHDFSKPLGADVITALRGQQKIRGGAEQFIRRFAASGDMNWCVNYDPMYKTKTPTQLVSVKQNLGNNIKRMRSLNVTINGKPLPNLELLTYGDDLIIVNSDAHAAAVAAGENNTEDTDDGNDTDDDDN